VYYRVYKTEEELKELEGNGIDYFTVYKDGGIFYIAHEMKEK